MAHRNYSFNTILTLIMTVTKIMTRQTILVVTVANQRFSIIKMEK